MKSAHIGVVPGIEEYLAELIKPSAKMAILPTEPLIPMGDKERKKYSAAAREQDEPEDVITYLPEALNASPMSSQACPKRRPPTWVFNRRVLVPQLEPQSAEQDEQFFLILVVAGLSVAGYAFRAGKISLRSIRRYSYPALNSATMIIRSTWVRVASDTSVGTLANHPATDY